MDYGFIIFGIGAALQAIGLSIALYTHPGLDNRLTRGVLDPKRPTKEEIITTDEYLDILFKDPKCRWWSWSGFAFSMVGLFLLLIGM